MAVAEKENATEHGDDHHHDHGEFIAHHFDTPQQQFDSGKLGVWLFLVTEILFFSGLFVAYTLYRNHHPEIFEQAHVFLDKYLGALNTLVLLFSSLTMAMGVRCSQLGNNRGVAFYTLITMVCAAMFLGVKAIEYSHKWDMGILVRSAFDYSPGHHAAPEGTLAHQLGISQYLVYISVIPTILLVAFAGLCGFFKMTGSNHLSKFFAGLAITVGGYFLGAVIGHYYMELTDGGLGGSHASQVITLHADSFDQEQPSSQHDKSAGDTGGEHISAADVEQAGHEAGPDEHADGTHAATDHGPDSSDFDRDIGTFFSIYYCMTGLHAFHILGGIAFLAWIYWRSILGHWRPDYFGPVEYVGLYWHLVDLIWIFLFPLLYLID